MTPGRDRGHAPIPPAVWDPGLRAARTKQLPYPGFTTLAALQAYGCSNAAGVMQTRRKPRSASAFIRGIAASLQTGP